MKRIALAVLSAVLLILSFPDFNFEFLAWIGLVPLFFAIDPKSPRQSFLISYLAGVVFFLGTIYWLIHVTLPGMIVVVLYLALYFGLFGLICAYFLRSAKAYVLLITIPAAWVSLEFIRTYFLTGFGWALLGYSQSFTLPVIQIADIVGAYGISFIIVLVNMAIFLTLKEVSRKDYSLVPLVIALSVIFICLYYGALRIRNIFPGERIKVAVVQGNIPQVKKWDPSFRRAILDKYCRLTKEAARTQPELIIWPETAVPGFIESEQDLLDRVTAISRDVNTNLLVGAPEEGGGRKESYFNSALLFNGNGKIISRYDKIHLVPFGEYVPLRPVFSFVENFAPSPIGDFDAGTDYKVFNFLVSRNIKTETEARHFIKKVNFSVLICFEDIFPDIARKFVSRGADLLVNITNDAWFGKTSAAYQHAQSSIFRAVENRINVVRAANTGVSCFINQKGEITGRVKSGAESVFVEGYEVSDLILTRARTFYNLYGDVFAYICLIIAAAYIFALRR